MAEEQWVNIDKDPKWVEDEVTAEERLGHLHFECEFKTAKIANFKIRVVSQGNKAKYSKKEMKRNKNFKLRFGQGSASNAGAKKIKLERDVYLPAAGGNKFKVEAKYKKHTVESSKIVETRRRLFFQNTAMTGIAHGDVSDMESYYWSHDHYFIKLKQKASNTMAFMSCLHSDDGAGNNNYVAFLQACKPAWQLQARMPYAYMLVWVNYIASGGTKQIDQEVDANIPSRLWSWGWKGQDFTFEVGEYLWHGLEPAHDTAQHWLVSIDVKFRDSNNVETRINIPNSRVTITGAARDSYGGYHQVKVDLSADDLAGVRYRFSRNEGKLVFSMVFRTVKGWTNGFSFNVVNVITTARKALWRDQTAAVEKYTLNHEFGHKIGMVADGVGRAPEKPATHYTGQSHMGDHCSNGATYDAATTRWSGAPTCVMFGADGTFSGTPPAYQAAPPTYCGTCEPIVRKLDLSAPIPGFANTPNNF